MTLFTLPAMGASPLHALPCFVSAQGRREQARDFRCTRLSPEKDIQIVLYLFWRKRKVELRWSFSRRAVGGDLLLGRVIDWANHVGFRPLIRPRSAELGCQACRTGSPRPALACPSPRRAR